MEVPTTELAKLCERLAEKVLEVEVEDKKVVAMPDFYVDHFIQVPMPFKEFVKRMEQVYQQKGGNVAPTRHYLLRGGNAANTVAALAKLGVEAYLVAETDELGFELAEKLLGEEGVHLEHVKVGARGSYTAALELEVEEGKMVNVMISDPGPVAEFDFSKLTIEDVKLIEEAELVCVFNWAQNRKGTELADEVFKLAKRSKGKTYFDPGDPSLKPSEVKRAREVLLTSGLLDFLSLNENEVRWFEERGEQLGEKVKLLSEDSLCEVDLHTAHRVYVGRNGAVVEVPTFRVEQRRSTGAGDSWNAGNIFGILVGFNIVERIIVANAVAAYYISHKRGEHPTRRDLARFLEERAEELMGG